MFDVGRFDVRRSSFKILLNVKETAMKQIIKLSVILIAILLFNNAFAAENIIGTWQGKLVVSPETELKIQFIISQGDDGSYTVVLNSPDQGAIKDIKANSVAYNSGNLKLDVAELSGAYEGIVKDGKIEGNWMQEGTSMPLSLTPYVKPVLTKEDKEKILGSWIGQLEFPGGSIAAVYRFEITKDGEFVGFADSPDQGAFGTPVTDMEMEDGTITIRVAAWQVEYKGKMTGDEIVGEFNQRGQTIPLTLEKGEYKPKTISLTLPEEDKKKLLGPWHGQLEFPGRSLTAVYRFEMTEGGEFVGFAASPDQGPSETPVTDIAVEGDTVIIKVSGLQVEFKGKMTGDEIVGEFKQRGQALPLILKKGEYKAPVYNLSLSKEDMDQLLGKWKGKLGPMTLVFRFEKTENVEFVGFFDSPDRGVMGLPITEAALSDGRITFKVKKVEGEFSGQLSGNTLSGDWNRMGQSDHLTLNKE